jgi:hypothetical protein
LQALLKAESKLRAQETQSSLLDDVASSLSTATAADTAAAARTAAGKHDMEVAAATRQLRQMAACQQAEQQRTADEQAIADKLNRCAYCSLSNRSYRMAWHVQQPQQHCHWQTHGCVVLAAYKQQVQKQ